MEELIRSKQAQDGTVPPDLRCSSSSNNNNSRDRRCHTTNEKEAFANEYDEDDQEKKMAHDPNYHHHDDANGLAPPPYLYASSSDEPEITTGDGESSSHWLHPTTTSSSSASSLTAAVGLPVTATSEDELLPLPEFLRRRTPTSGEAAGAAAGSESLAASFQPSLLWSSPSSAKAVMAGVASASGRRRGSSHVVPGAYRRHGRLASASRRSTRRGQLVDDDEWRENNGWGSSSNEVVEHHEPSGGGVGGVSGKRGTSRTFSGSEDGSSDMWTARSHASGDFSDEELGGRPQHSMMELAVAMPVDDEELVLDEIPAAIEYDPDAKPSQAKPPLKVQRQTRRIRRWGSLVLLIIVLVIVVSVLLVTLLNRPSAPATAIENSYLLHSNVDWLLAASQSTTTTTATARDNLGLTEFIAQAIAPQLPSSLSIAARTPYLLAMDWIVNQDPFQLTIESPTLVQRYIAAYFYFAMTQNNNTLASCNALPINASSWSSSSPPPPECTFRQFQTIGPPALFSDIPSTRWLSNSSECLWGGLQCDFHGQITHIQMST